MGIMMSFNSLLSLLLIGVSRSNSMSINIPLEEEEMLKNSKLSIDIAINADRVRGNRLIRHAQSANYSNNTGATTNSTNLGSLEAIGAFIGTVAAGASVAKAVEGYGVKIDIR